MSTTEVTSALKRISARKVTPAEQAAPSAPAYADSDRILQIRNLDPEVKRNIKIECAVQDVTVATLLEAMWLAYQRERARRQAPSR